MRGTLIAVIEAMINSHSDSGIEDLRPRDFFDPGVVFLSFSIDR